MYHQLLFYIDVLNGHEYFIFPLSLMRSLGFIYSSGIHDWKIHEMCVNIRS